MTALTARLTEIGARVEAATPGPWTWAYHETADADMWAVFDATDHAIATNSDGWGPDAVFIATARNDMPGLVEALRRVLEVHRPVVRYPGGRKNEVCDMCYHPSQSGVPGRWPCPTVRAVADAMGVES